MRLSDSSPRGFDILQKISVSLMTVLVIVTFIGANLHAVLWQSSSWLVSTVLPAVVVELTNEQRADLQEAPLRRNATLDAAAKLKAEHMAKNQYFAHYSPDGVSPWYWFNEAGYVFAHAGENLAIHFTDSSEVVEAWMDSPTHRANIVNQNYTEIGVGTAKGTYEGYDTVYVVQLFGTPAVPPAPKPVPTQVTAVAIASSEIETPTTTTDSLPDTDTVAGIETEIPHSEPPVITTTSTTPSTSPELPTLLPQAPAVVNDAPVMASNSYRIEDLGNEVVTVSEDSVIIETTISTSSGLAVATTYTDNQYQAGTTAVSMATQPNELLQWIYIILGSVVVALLLFSAVFEARRFHYLQVAYSIALIVAMGGLFLIHTWLTSGAVIV